jgi:hypothetical protein
MGAMAYSKAILLDAEKDKCRDHFSSSIRGRIIRRIYITFPIKDLCTILASSSYRPYDKRLV